MAARREALGTESVSFVRPEAALIEVRDALIEICDALVNSREAPGEVRKALRSLGADSTEFSPESCVGARAMTTPGRARP